MPDLDLRPQRRDDLVAQLTVALEAAVNGSEVRLRGSLATGTADSYSDVDLLWVVPEGHLTAAEGALRGAIEGVAGGLDGLRVDPDWVRSDRRRLVYARLTGVPFFWRVDIDLRERSIADDDTYDADNPAAREEEGWSRPASAMENAGGAVKQIIRGNLLEVDGLLQRGYERIGLRFDPRMDRSRAIEALAGACAVREPGLASRAAEVAWLASFASVVVREAGEADMPAFLDLAGPVENLFGPMVNDDGFHASLRRNVDRGSALVAEATGEVIGGLLFSFKEAPVYRVGWLVVAESHRSIGVGARLIRSAIDRWVRRPATVEVVTFGADHPGARARRFYEGLGFAPGETVDNGPEGGSRQVDRLEVR